MLLKGFDDRDKITGASDESGIRLGNIGAAIENRRRKNVATNLAHRGDGSGADPASEVTLNGVIIFSEVNFQACIHFRHEYDCGTCLQCIFWRLPPRQRNLPSRAVNCDYYAPRYVSSCLVNT
jgi:hypothetical protein